jgi:hypothetical protein
MRKTDWLSNIYIYRKKWISEVSLIFILDTCVREKGNAIPVNMVV